MLCTLLLAACSGLPTTRPLGPIRPGESVGATLITTGEAEGVTFSWNVPCAPKGASGDLVCNAPVGQRVNVSAGVIFPGGAKSLDTLWAQHTSTFTIDDRPVDLAAFGTFDLAGTSPTPIRVWNVVVVASKPGRIAVHENGMVDGHAFDSTMTYIFEAP